MEQFLNYLLLWIRKLFPVGIIDNEYAWIQAKWVEYNLWMTIIICRYLSFVGTINKGSGLWDVWTKLVIKLIRGILCLTWKYLVRDQEFPMQIKGLGNMSYSVWNPWWTNTQTTSPSPKVKYMLSRKIAENITLFMSFLYNGTSSRQGPLVLTSRRDGVKDAVTEEAALVS